MNALVASIQGFLAGLHPLGLGAMFVLLFAGSMLLVPWVVVQIPADYFMATVRRPPLWSHYPPWLRLLLILAKNLVGLLLLLTGVLLLVLPGPGVMTMVIGLLMLDVPGKFRFERWMLGHRFVLQPVNWLRIKNKRLALQLD